MLKVVSSLCAAAMAVSLPFVAPATAMPQISPSVGDSRAAPLLVQERAFESPTGERIYRRGGHHYWRGHRGYREPRPGYRRQGDFWFPPAAFIAGAIIGGAMSAQEPPVRYRPRGNAHIDWCYDRYRSYRASDNSYQPYNGPRRQCRSPYG